MKFLRPFLAVGLSLTSVLAQNAAGTLELSGSKLRLRWQHEVAGWKLAKIDVADSGTWRALETPSGAYTYLYRPSTAPAGYLVNRSLSSGARTFFPAEGTADGKGRLTFRHSTSDAEVIAHWWIDEGAPTDVRVEVTLATKRNGYYSLATPTLAAVSPADLGWGLIPGAWYGAELQPDLELATTYSMGIPSVPMLSKEANTMTLCALLSTRSGITFGVAPNPGTSSDPWPNDRMERDQNRVGLSLMNRHSQLAPVAYSPIHGGPGSLCKPGDSRTLGFRYVIQAGSWFPAFRHVAADIYRFSDLLMLQRSTRSLADRISQMQIYLRDDKRSQWKTMSLEGREIGMYGSKNSDVAAAYMVANNGGDNNLTSRRTRTSLSSKLPNECRAPWSAWFPRSNSTGSGRSRRTKSGWLSRATPISRSAEICRFGSASSRPLPMPSASRSTHCLGEPCAFTLRPRPWPIASSIGTSMASMWRSRPCATAGGRRNSR